MLTACNPRHSHGRLFLFNVMVTSRWRAKLSEYALDPYLITRGGLGSAGGYDLLPSKKHPANSVLFLSPEKCSGRIAPVVQPRRVPTTTEPTACRRGWASDLRRLARTQRSSFVPIAPSDAQPAEPKTTSTADTHGLLAVGNEAMAPGARSGSPASLAGCPSAVLEAQMQGTMWMDEQCADAWAFGALLATLALHEKRAKEHSKVELHASQRWGHAKSAASGWKVIDDQLADDMYGWEEGASVSKDQPGRFTSRSKQLVAATSLPEPAAALAAEGRPLSRRDPRVERKFKALVELSRQLKNSKVSSSGSCSDHSESNDTNAPPPSAPPFAPPSAPPSPPETSPADAHDAAPALAHVVAHQTSAEDWSLERPCAEIKEAARFRLKADVDRRRQQGRVRFAPSTSLIY